MSRAPVHMRCAFCGADVEYGLALCINCDAHISYDAKERTQIDGQTEVDVAKMRAKTERALKDAEQAPWPFRSWAIKDANKTSTQSETLVDDVIRKSNAAVDRRIARGGTVSLVTFERGERVVDVSVAIPADPDAKVDFDVVLLSHNGQKR